VKIATSTSPRAIAAAFFSGSKSSGGPTDRPDGCHLRAAGAQVRGATPVGDAVLRTAIRAPPIGRSSAFCSMAVMTSRQVFGSGAATQIGPSTRATPRAAWGRADDLLRDSASTDLLRVLAIDSPDQRPGADAGQEDDDVEPAGDELFAKAGQPDWISSGTSRRAGATIG